MITSLEKISTQRGVTLNIILNEVNLTNRSNTVEQTRGMWYVSHLDPCTWPTTHTYVAIWACVSIVNDCVTHTSFWWQQGVQLERHDLWNKFLLNWALLRFLYLEQNASTMLPNWWICASVNLYPTAQSLAINPISIYLKAIPISSTPFCECTYCGCVSV